MMEEVVAAEVAAEVAADAVAAAEVEAAEEAPKPGEKYWHMVGVDTAEQASDEAVMFVSSAGVVARPSLLNRTPPVAGSVTSPN